MVRRANIVVLLLTGLGLVFSATTTAAQTNMPPPSWRLTPPPPTKSLPEPNVPATRTPPPSVSPDADLFFMKFKEAVRLFRENRTQDAAILMDGASKTLDSSPWMEIALLKHAALVESRNDLVAMEDYTVLRKRLENAPYFQGTAEKARAFGVALQGAIDGGINRIRIRRVTDALSRYHVRYSEYPESLTKLSILGYIPIEDIHAANEHLFHYLPTGQVLRPFVSYQNYDLQSIPPEPLTVTSPKLETTSLINEAPPKYAAVVRVPGRSEPARVIEDQTIQGYFVAAVASGGALLCTQDRVLVLPTGD